MCVSLSRTKSSADSYSTFELCVLDGSETVATRPSGLPVVKVNAEQLLRKELTAKSWKGEHIAMGTNVDPYQRAEGRYKLMRGILAAQP